MGDTVINNIRYADDTVSIKPESQLQQLMYTVVEQSWAKGLFLNTSKSLNMVFSKSDLISTCKITLHDNRLDQVDKCVYCSRPMTDANKTENNHCKIFILMIGKVLKKRSIDFQLKYILMKCYAWSAMLYGAQT